MTHLPLDARGYPVPWFVQWVDGQPEFRAMDPRKWNMAVSTRRCWVCGGPLGVHMAFLIGPMCAINRTTSEPPCHLECAVYSALNCPFMSRPKMHRREDEDINAQTCAMAGIPVMRNPGVGCVWVCRRYSVFRAHGGNGANPGLLIEIGDPEEVQWYAHGRKATRDEVTASLDSGLPLLHQQIDLEPEADRHDALAELDKRIAFVTQLLPAA